MNATSLPPPVAQAPSSTRGTGAAQKPPHGARAIPRLVGASGRYQPSSASPGSCCSVPPLRGRSGSSAARRGRGPWGSCHGALLVANVGEPKDPGANRRIFTSLMVTTRSDIPPGSSKSSDAIFRSAVAPSHVVRTPIERSAISISLATELFPLPVRPLTVTRTSFIMHVPTCRPPRANTRQPTLACVSRPSSDHRAKRLRSDGHHHWPEIAEPLRWLLRALSSASLLGAFRCGHIAHI